VAEDRHKRDAEARRTPAVPPRALRVIAPLAVLATAGAVGVGLLATEPATRDLVPISSATTEELSVAAQEATAADAEAAEARSQDPTTRSNSRLTLPSPVPQLAPAYMSKAAIHKAIAGADERLWTTTDLNVWTNPGEKAKQTGEVEAGKKVLVTGREMWGRTEIVVGGKSRWVTDGYLSSSKPAGIGAGLSMTPCPDGSVENGLTDGAVYVYRSVCNAFPEITSYGGWDAHGEHSSGKALDIMTSDVDLGNAIAAFLQAHASELHLYDIIWRQHIWTPVRASEGWRGMPSRGSATANHYDHVHVAVY
jgi:hypothetical protein